MKCLPNIYSLVKALCDVRYIATVAMLPSIVSNNKQSSSLLQTALEIVAFMLGVAVMVAVALFE